MRTNVYFRTDLFESRTPQPHFINPNCFGDDLARWLLRRLQGMRFSLSEPTQEDYGWGFWAQGKYWVAVGLIEDSGQPPEWLIAVDYDPGLNLRERLFGQADADTLARLCAAVHAALKSEPRIADVRWCDNDDADCGEAPG
jgi:hypothetical protein